MENDKLAQLAVMKPWFKGDKLAILISKYGQDAVYRAFSRSNMAISHMPLRYKIPMKLMRISRRWRHRLERLQHWLEG